MAIKKTIEKFIPRFVLSLYHYCLALVGAVTFGFPSRKVKVIGVTGTKGKSSTVILTGKILEEAGYKVAWLTSATIKIGEKEILNPYHMTMPGRFVIQKFLADAVKADCQYAIVEITSEGIKQHRHRFIDIDTAVFTNLQPEHLEAHGSFENYRYCKGLLFKSTSKNHVINIDDKNSEYFLQFPAEMKIKYSTTSADPGIIFAKDIHEGREGISFKVKNIDFKSKLLGKFNVYNCLAAICVGIIQKVSLEKAKEALEKFETMPGRMEVIQENPFKVIVDLAHTPDSYEEVFRAVKAMPHNKIVTVFGSAGGGRDKWKRPVLGKIASHNSDILIVTNEDPYDENPEQIISDIKKDIKPDRENFYIILDRREAIAKGLKSAKENDIVLILGKGTEQLMFLPTGKIKWDDREVVREEIFKIK